MTSVRQTILTLLIVSILCGLVLSFVFAFTTPRINETKKNLIGHDLKTVIDAQKFVEVIPETLWQAIDSLGTNIGIVFQVFPQGFGGPIPILVGINLASKITGIKIASMTEGLKETPGLGSKITEPDFTEQFIDKGESELLLKNEGGRIDAVTGATISSRAVTSGIKQGIEKYSNYLGPQPIDKKNVFPEAQKYIEIIKDTLWYALGDADTLGIVFIGVTQGYVDYIKFIVGVDKHKKIKSIEILSSHETEGIGDKIKDRVFLDKFKDGFPDAITGATISSQTFINGVKANLERFKVYLK